MFAQKLGAMSVSDASSPAPADSTAASIDTAIERAHRLLLRTQEPDGHWVGELEADSTISSEYLLFCHILDRVDREREAKIVAQQALPRERASGLLFGAEQLAQTCASFDGDPFSYGVSANRAMLDTVVRLCREQGIVRDARSVEQLFVPGLIDG